MGRLFDFFYQKITQKLNKLGFEFYPMAKEDHEIWFNPKTKAKTTIPHHREIKEGTLRNILKQAKIDVDTFLTI
ncbi:YcfA family protein [Cyanobacterium aponinum PCC 10605]|uniref:YcfA family protein n=2 Tax=Cyanobacterium aponinum TaxID=379064 RepID=K9Z7W9_CYAAP|nr:YcfA family protein [Cyanobacterium aponinum PCC 10605]MTF40612.1 addiction module toxin, HicA family [Cyanobacterium aponinum 0216]